MAYLNWAGADTARSYKFQFTLTSPLMIACINYSLVHSIYFLQVYTFAKGYTVMTFQGQVTSSSLQIIVLQYTVVSLLASKAR